ncbi:flagellin, partial [uncultured Clostridium sp.]|uniref:flagellin n=1 Tax=uncultured Clostridium sp. TaxID=59620 RepID=UPI0025CF32F2
IDVTMQSMDTAKLGIENLDMATSANASAALAKIETAITTVSEHRATLGAVQNRLEHTIASTDTTSENLQASESRIRDTDMAKEMMEYTKSNILTQAAQSMLAQANSAPNSVLQLLQ